MYFKNGCPEDERLTDDIKRERDESMVGGEGQEEGIHKDDVLEVVDQTLAIEKVVCAE